MKKYLQRGLLAERERLPYKSTPITSAQMFPRLRLKSLGGFLIAVIRGYSYFIMSREIWRISGTLAWLHIKAHWIRDKDRTSQILLLNHKYFQRWKIYCWYMVKRICALERWCYWKFWWWIRIICFEIAIINKKYSNKDE